MLIAQISDLHIPVSGKKTYGIAPMAENLKRCIEHINNFVPQIDLVLVTGDITNASLSEEFDHASELLANLQMPFYVIPGNHDDRTKLLETFKNAHCPVEDSVDDFVDKDDFINYVIETNELRFVALDSTIPGKPGGEICNTRATWLDQRLAEDTDKPCIVFMHHPPVKCGVIETDIDGFIGARRLGNVVEKYSNIEAILCGHIHTPAHTRWHGTVVSTAPSMGMRLVLDFTLEQKESFTHEAAAFQLHYWTKYNNLITHTISAKDFDGPYLFEEYPVKER